MEQQLQRLNEWHEAIESRDHPGSTSTEFLADCWKDMEAACPNIQANKSHLLRGRTHNDQPPLAQFFEYVEDGLYPPPELLLTILDAWRTYRESGGDLLMEDAFFGGPKPKAGNYARQAMKKRKDLGAAFELGKYQSQGKSKEDAAQLIADKYGGSAGSISRIKPIRPLDDSEESEK
jgi:hypothetical protein